MDDKLMYVSNDDDNISPSEELKLMVEHLDTSILNPPINID